MWSRRLWRYISALVVIVVLSVVLVLKITQQSVSWEKVSSEGLGKKMQATLEQIYWQWQNEGRPKTLMFEKEVNKSPVKLLMDIKGVPIFEASKEGCIELFKLFIGEKYPFERLEVEITAMPEQSLPPTKEGLKKLKLSLVDGDTKRREILHLCKFKYANRIYFYQLNSGELTIY